MLCSAVGGGWVSDFPENSITNVYGSMLLALRGVGGCQIPRRKCYVILE